MSRTTVALITLLVVGTLGAATPAFATAPVAHSAFAALQQAAVDTVRGRVTDADTGAPLPGVNVVAAGTTVGTATGSGGRYTLAAPDDADSLVFSFVGFETTRVPIDGRSVIDVVLEPLTVMGEEVVVVGYGTQQRGQLTGAISSVREEDFRKGVNSSVDQLLQGKIPGVRVVQNSGEPGGGASISIRGASSINAGTEPLYVIDGVPLDNAPAVAGTGAGFVGSRSPRNPIASINPADIESIEVLKDASATAIYGARGANGVVMITTKSGRDARALRINYDGYAGVQQAINSLDLLTPQEYQRVLNEIIADGGGNPEAEVTEIANGGAGTDWQDEVFAESPIVQSHNLSFSGATEETSYYASLNAFIQDGVVVSSGFKRYSGRVNLDHRFTDRFNFGLNLSSSYTNDDYVPAGFGLNENAGALYAAYNFDPTLPIRDADGEYLRSDFITIDNPLALAYGELSDQDSYRTYGSATGEYHFFPALSAMVRLGADVVNSRRDTYITRQTLDGLANGGIATVLEGTNYNYLVEGTVTYDETFGAHDVNLLGGVTAQQFETRRSSATGRNYPSDRLLTNALGRGDPSNFEIGSTQFGHQLLSYIGRLNYGFQSKYLLTATLRVDGSSRFGEDNKFGYFPSIAAAWRLSDEDFIRNYGVFSTLKLRASWGQTGNQAIGNYNSLVTFDPGPTVVFDDQLVTTLDPARMPNPALKWETTEQWDIGLDFGFMADRVYGSLDYYQKDTFDMLLNRPVPFSTGFAFQLSNVGSIKNSGLEFEIVSRNLTGPFGWRTSANFATLNNEVQELGAVDAIITGNAGFTSEIGIIQEGVPLRSYYGYEIIGIWQEDDDFSATTDPVNPGDLKFRDLNNDGTVNADDRVVLGCGDRYDENYDPADPTTYPSDLTNCAHDAFPNFTWSLGNTFSFANISLDVFIEGVHGVHMLNNNLVDTYFPVNFRRNKLAEPFLNRWTPENPSNTYPSFVTPTSQGLKAVNTYTVQDASYVRLQSVRLSYRLPQWTSAYQSATIYFNAENLVTLTDYDGIDPALNPNGNANFRIDYNAYPQSTTYTLGVRLGL